MSLLKTLFKKLATTPISLQISRFERRRSEKQKQPLKAQAHSIKLVWKSATNKFNLAACVKLGSFAYKLKQKLARKSKIAPDLQLEMGRTPD